MGQRFSPADRDQEFPPRRAFRVCEMVSGSYNAKAAPGKRFTADAELNLVGLWLSQEKALAHADAVTQPDRTSTNPDPGQQGLADRQVVVFDTDGDVIFTYDGRPAAAPAQG